MATINRKKLAKILAIILVLYIALVVLFESLLGYFQPEAGLTMVVTTFDEQGASHDRVVARLELDDQVYVAVNHWPRAWYGRLRENAEMQGTFEDAVTDYTANILSGDEHDKAAVDFAVPFSFRFLTGFPPRYFIRLDPR